MSQDNAAAVNDRWRRGMRRTRPQSLRLKRVIAGVAAVCLGTILLCLLIYGLWGPKYSVSGAILAIDNYPPLLEQAALYVEKDAEAVANILAAAAAESDGGKLIRLKGSEDKSVKLFLMNDGASLDDPDDVASIDSEILILYAPLHLVCQLPEENGNNSGPQRTELGIACSGYHPDTSDGRLPFAELVTSIRASKADTKLLILDTGRAPTGPREGILVGECFDELQNLLKREAAGHSNENPAEPTGDDELAKESGAEPTGDLWVLTSHGPWERSHLLYEKQRSVFGFFLEKALRGEADNGDNELTLGELCRYLHRHVSGFVWHFSKGKHVQTPTLLHVHGDHVEVIEPEEYASEGHDANRVRILRMSAKKADESEKAAADEKSNETAKATESDATPEGGDPKHDETRPDAGPSGAAATDANSSSDTEPAQMGVADRPADAPTSKPLAVADPENPTESSSDQSPKSEGATSDEKASPIEKSPSEQSDRAVVSKVTTSIEWSPVDYAPHEWRRLQEMLSAFPNDSGSAISISDQDRLKRGFSNSQLAADLQRDASLHTTFQTRNRLLFQIPYYIRLCPNEETRDKVNDLIEKLGALENELEEPLIFRPISTVGTEDGTEDRLALISDQQQELVGFRDDLEDLRIQVRELLALGDDHTDNELEKRDPVYWRDLLQTPLPNAHQRTQIRKRLRASEKSSLKGDLPDPPNADKRRKAQERHRNRLRYQVELHAHLLNQLGLDIGETTEPDATRRVTEDIAVDSKDEESRSLRRAAEAVRASYRGIPDLLNADSVARIRRDVGLRLLAPFDAGKFTQRVIDGWSDVGLKLTEEYLRLSPTFDTKGVVLDDKTTRTWLLEATGMELPATFQVKPKFDKSLLEVDVVGDEGANGRLSIENRKLGRFEIRLNIKPRKRNGQVAPLTVSLEGIDAVDRVVTSQPVEFHLPQPRFLEVSVAPRPPHRGSAVEHLFKWRWTASPGGKNGKIEATAFRLKPYPSGRTGYHLKLRNGSETKKRTYRYTIWVVPDDVRNALDDLDSNRRNDQKTIDRLLELLDDVRTQVGTELVSREEMIVPAGEEKPLPFVPAPPKKADADDATGGGTEDAPKPSTEPSSAEPPEVSGGLLIDLVEQKKVAGEPGSRQLIWLDMKVLHPEVYVTPDPSYVSVSGTRKLDIECHLIREKSPNRPVSVDWLVPPELLAHLESPSLRTVLKNATSQQGLLSATVKDSYRARRFPVILSVDGYDRAFEYDRTFGVQNVDPILIDRRRLSVALLKDEEGQVVRNKEEEPTVLPDRAAFQKLLRVHARLEADFPRLTGDRYFARLVLETKSGDRITHEFRRDREFDIRLATEPSEEESKKSGSGDLANAFWLKPTARELIHTFDTEGYLEQELTVRAMLFTRGSDRDSYELDDTRLRGPFQSPSATVIHDSVKPTIGAVRAVDELFAKLPASIDVTVTDDNGSGVDYVKYSMKSEDELLKEPQSGRAERFDNHSFNINLPKDEIVEGRNTVHLMAWDRAGNRSLPEKWTFDAVPKPEPPPRPMENSLEVTVRVFDKPAKSVRVTVMRADGSPIQKNPKNDGRGRYIFDDLKPGKYLVHAHGVFQNDEKEWPEQEVTVLPPPSPPAQVDLVLR